MLWVIVFHALLGAAILALGRNLGRRSFWLAALGPASILAWVSMNYRADAPVKETLTWVPALGVDLTLHIDGFALLMLVLIGVAGVAIFGYAARYMSDEPRSARFAALMVMFGGAMAGIVTADNLLGLFVFWEITTITSYLLIGHDDQRPTARASALQAALTTATGGLAMLAGFVLLAGAAGSWSLSAILASPPAGVDVALVLILLGAFTKSAQVPFHFWLPGAMAAPTPASAFLHSATMVKAGVYLIARLSPAFSYLEWWQPLIVTVGLATMFVGGWRALRQHDLKLLLAHGTVSQLGFMVVVLGIGGPETAFAGAALILAHGLFKATLFMVVGAVDHGAGGRDIRKLSGLRRTMPLTFWIGVMAAASMAAIPPLYGFVAKESVFEALVHADPLIAVLVAAASVLTVAYSARFIFVAFTGELSEEAASAHEQFNGLVLWPGLLAVASLAFGLMPSLIEPIVKLASDALTGTVEGKLLLWHGLKPALALSVGTLALGAILSMARIRAEAWQGRFAQSIRWIPSAESVYDRLLRGTMKTADDVTAVVQNGSLPAYLATIALTAVGLPTLLALTAGSLRLRLPEGASLTEWSLVAIIVLASAGLIRVQRRYGAVLLLGSVGYAVAGLFLLQGGPDLALTQLLIESLVVLLFALVLTKLPSHFNEPRRAVSTRIFRAATATAVALFVAFAGIAASNQRSEVPVSEMHIEASLPEAGGANVVNVILVDFRGFDTLGEITVLVIAALGVAGLVMPLLAAKRRDSE